MVVGLVLELERVLAQLVLELLCLSLRLVLAKLLSEQIAHQP
jgi:hypothetical protein